MLCVSAVFATARCPSVHPSVTLVHCIQTDEDIVKFLSPPSSPFILVFFNSERRYPIPRRTPSAGAQNTRGRKILRFSTEIAVCLGNGTKKKKNFIKPQYNNSINTQHCGRLSEKTNVHHAGHLNKTHTHTHRKRDNPRTQNYKVRKKGQRHRRNRYEIGP